MPYIGQGRFVRGSNALEMPFKIIENIKSLKKFQQLLVHYKITGVGRFSHRFVRTGLVSLFCFVLLAENLFKYQFRKKLYVSRFSNMPVFTNVKIVNFHFFFFSRPNY